MTKLEIGKVYRDEDGDTFEVVGPGKYSSEYIRIRILSLSGRGWNRGMIGEELDVADLARGGANPVEVEPKPAITTRLYLVKHNSQFACGWYESAQAAIEGFEEEHVVGYDDYEVVD